MKKFLKYMLLIFIVFNMININGAYAAYSPLDKILHPDKNHMVLYGKQVQFKDVSGNIAAIIYMNGGELNISSNVRITQINANDITTGTLHGDRLDTGQDITKQANGVVNTSEFENSNGTTGPIQPQLDLKVDLGSEQTITGNKTFGTGTSQFRTGGDRVTVDGVINSTGYASNPSNAREGDEYYNTTNHIKYVYNGTTWKAMHD